MKMKNKIELILQQFPEVTWDRFTGVSFTTTVFGSIPRDDGRFDFIVLKILDGRLISFLTSSAHYSPIFSERLGFTHADCQRIEHHFPNVPNVAHEKP